MTDYICSCCDHEETSSGVGIKVVDGVAKHNIKCPCGKYMELKSPKEGVPSFRSDSHGRVY